MIASKNKELSDDLFISWWGTIFSRKAIPPISYILIIDEIIDMHLESGLLFPWSNNSTEVNITYTIDNVSKL